MLRHGVEDVRHFMSGDLRFLRQFHGGLEGMRLSYNWLSELVDLSETTPD